MSDERSSEPGGNTDKREAPDRFAFAYSADSMLKIVKALKAAKELEYCLEQAIKHLVGEYPPSHPAYELAIRCRRALKHWQEGAGI